MWVMKKKIKGNVYLYLYKSLWINGKPVSKYVRYLGPKDKVNKARLGLIIAEEESGK